MSDSTVLTKKTLPTTSLTGRSKRLLWYGISFALVLITLAFAFAYHNISDDRKNMEEDLMQRQATMAASRAETTDAWLGSLVERSVGLITSDLFQLYASEVDKIPGGVPLLFQRDKDAPPPNASMTLFEEKDQIDMLLDQLPLMRTMLADFVAQYNFDCASIVNSKAELYLSTQASMPAPNSVQRKFVADVVQTGQAFFAPLEMGQKGITLDIYVPIMPPAYRQQNNMPVAVLVLSLVVDSKLGEVLSPGVAAEKGRQIRLVQKNGDIYQNVMPGGTLLRQASNFVSPSGSQLPFALRKAVGSSADVYSSGFRLRSTDWWLMVENDASLVQGALADRAKTVYTLAGVVSIALILLIFAVWWRLMGQQQYAINTEITNLLNVIEHQKKLLDGINSTMTDPISLTDVQGVYRYVNNAFALAVGRKADEVTGLDGPAIFGFDTAKRLNASDQHVLMTGESISITEVLWLQSKRYHFQISKTPLREAGTRTTQGIVSVFRDITQLVETQERSRRVVQQTIDALVRAIEEADPFLGGHSRIMGGIASLMAKQLRLSEADVATIEAAANLSQIGKMFVPREILQKPDTLLPEEKVEMERHVEHARNVLKGIEFDLPVVEAIYQMNERLDGGGYPRALTGGQITTHARVLAVANAFTAMAKPRSYRAALPMDQVLTILEQRNESYDPNVVEALKQVIATPAGERLVEQAASVKAV